MTEKRISGKAVMKGQTIEKADRWAKTQLNAALHRLLDGTTLHVGLSFTEPHPDGSGVSEPDEIDGYARVCTDRSYWAVRKNMIVNERPIVFPPATGPWFGLSYVVLFDQQIGGNMLVWDRLTMRMNVESGAVIRIKSGDLRTLSEEEE